MNDLAISNHWRPTLSTFTGAAEDLGVGSGSAGIAAGNGGCVRPGPAGDLFVKKNDPRRQAPATPAPGGMTGEQWHEATTTSKERSENVFFRGERQDPVRWPAHEQRTEALEQDKKNPNDPPPIFQRGRQARAANYATGDSAARSKRSNEVLMAARQQVESNRPLVDEYFRRTANPTTGTPPPKAEVDRMRQDYSRVEKLVERDPAANLSLQQMLLDGTLHAKDSQGSTLLSSLSRRSESIDPRFSKEQVVSELVREIHTPESIRQGDRGTCVATNAQAHLARTQPAEYGRVVLGLASREGSVTMRGGETLARNPTSDAEDGSGRTVPSRIFQSSVMEWANGPKRTYDNVTDQHSAAPLGLGDNDLARSLTQLTGEKWEVVKAGEPFARGSFIGSKENRPYFAAIDWDGIPHSVAVTSMPSHTNPWVAIRNPQGQEQWMPGEVFERRLERDAIDGHARIVRPAEHY